MIYELILNCYLNRLATAYVDKWYSNQTKLMINWPYRICGENQTRVCSPQVSSTTHIGVFLYHTTHSHLQNTGVYFWGRLMASITGFVGAGLFSSGAYTPTCKPGNVKLRRTVKVGAESINPEIRKSEEKVVDSVDLTQLAKPITPYCRFIPLSFLYTVSDVVLFMFCVFFLWVACVRWEVNSSRMYFAFVISWIQFGLDCENLI